VTLVLGIDGGGTKTHALVLDEAGAVRGFATDGPGNWEVVGLRGAGDAIREAAHKALAEAGARPGDLAAAVFGLAGVDWPSDVPRLTGEAEQLGTGGPILVQNDAFVALRAGAPSGWGVVVIGGTGSVAAGRTRDGRTFRTLGQGAELGDTGSASDVSDAGLRAVADAYTGRGPATELTELMCSLYGCRSAAELLEQASRGVQRARSAAPTVLRAAAAGDEVACGIVIWAGRCLGESAALVARRLEMGGDEFDLVLAGGLFRGESGLLLETVRATVAAAAPGARPVPLEAPPVAGAALAALELAGVDAGGAVHAAACAAALEVVRRPVGVPPITG
jgi:N-acetylglucosamine kinase-like BadF-type ATPase